MVIIFTLKRWQDIAFLLVTKRCNYDSEYDGNFKKRE